MTIKCCLVDDEVAAHKGLKIALKDHADFVLDKNYHSVDEVFSSDVNTQGVDVLFLDIEMPREQGFAVIERWPNQLPIIVFVTAYNQYALKAFEMGSFDYLLKPLEQSRVDDCLHRIRQRHSEKQTYMKREKVEALYQVMKKNAPEKEISVKTDEGLFRVKQAEIDYIEAAGNFVAYQIGEKTLISRDSLKNLENALSQDVFIRIHKSFLININKVSSVHKGKFGDGSLQLISGKELKVSRRYKQVFSKLAC